MFHTRLANFCFRLSSNIKISFKIKIKQTGSCWAFSGVSSIESRGALANKVLTNLSEQQIVDCTYRSAVFPTDHDGCQGVC